jgi:nitrite reductase (NADH) large subunit
VKARVLEDAGGRKALFGRLQYALQGEKDPWVERARGAAHREFEALTAETQEPA